MKKRSDSNLTSLGTQFSVLTDRLDSDLSWNSEISYILKIKARNLPLSIWLKAATAIIIQTFWMAVLKRSFVVFSLYSNSLKHLSLGFIHMHENRHHYFAVKPVQRLAEIPLNPEPRGTPVFLFLSRQSGFGCLVKGHVSALLFGLPPCLKSTRFLWQPSLQHGNQGSGEGAGVKLKSRP